MTSPMRRDPAITIATPEQVGSAMARAWVALTDTIPSQRSIALLIAHWAIETGWGKACHAWNLGNIKSTATDGRDYCYFACNEIFDNATADRYVASAAPREDGKGPNAVLTRRVANGKSIVWFYPTHTACRFRAYETLDAGTLDYLRLLRGRYANAWPAIVSGSPFEYVTALKARGYFTASLEEYRNTVTSCFQRALRYKYEIPLFTEGEKQEILGWIGETTRSWIDDNT